MDERIDGNDDLAEIEQWLATRWDLDAPFGVEETVDILQDLLERLAVLATVDVATLYAAAEGAQLGQAWGTLQVLAGLAGRLSEGA